MSLVCGLRCTVSYSIGSVGQILIRAQLRGLCVHIRTLTLPLTSLCNRRREWSDALLHNDAFILQDTMISCSLLVYKWCVHVRVVSSCGRRSSIGWFGCGVNTSCHGFVWWWLVTHVEQQFVCKLLVWSEGWRFTLNISCTLPTAISQLFYTYYSCISNSCTLPVAVSQLYHSYNSVTAVFVTAVPYL